MSELTVDRLRELFTYNPDTGEWARNVRRSHQMPGKMALRPKKTDGYARIRIDRMMFPAHRLSWLYVHGQWPVGVIDHINGIKTDNRISNLRDTDRKVNSQNLRGARADSKTGLLGASRLGPSYAATIRINGKKVHLGVFQTPEEAHERYLQEKRIAHPECTI